MGPREIVDDFLHGRINSWGVFRRLVRLGLTTATALTVASSLPGAVQSSEFGTLTAAVQSPEEVLVVNVLVSHLASQLSLAAKGGPLRPLATALAQIGANNTNLANCNNGECRPIPININNDSVNLYGWLSLGLLNVNVNSKGPVPALGNLLLNVNGNIGETAVNISGAIIPPPNHSNGNNVNLGAVNLNLGVRLGEVSLNLNGNLAKLKINED
jgi:hypothetical protein